MSERVSREMLRSALIDAVPNCEVVAGRICLAAMRRSGEEVSFDGDMCYFAAERFSTNCLGTVNADGTEVADSLADGGGCLRVQEVDADLDALEQISPIQ